jgi:hypothetical protein
VDGGLETDLILKPLAECALAETNGVVPDPQVRLENLSLYAGDLSITMQNDGLGSALGVLYLNVYDTDGNPIHGQTVSVENEAFPLEPGEHLNLITLLSSLSWIEPQPGEYDFIFLGLSQ